VLTPSLLGRLLDDLTCADRGPEELTAGLTVVVAGDRLPVSLHDRARDVGLVVHHYYGAAELSFVAWGGHADDLRAFPGVEVDVRDGEIWVRSPYLCSGYAGSGGPLRRDPPGFATVGDRGRLQRDRLTVDGRPGAVTTGGATVQLAEVEAVLRPVATGEVVAVGVPHAHLGEVVIAVLTVAEDRHALVARAREGLSAGARPRAWYHVAELPLTGAGKVDRSRLASQLSGPVPPRRLT
jgi:long-chain acyl-CoA synthetase